MTELLILFAGALFAYYFWDSQGAKEQATRLARQACQQRHLQFLDFSVETLSTKLVKGHGGQPQWRRQYHFDFHVGGALGDERYGATLTLLGRRIETMHFDPHPVPDENIHYVDRPGRCMRR